MNVKLVTIGKKATTFFKRRPEYNLVKTFEMGNAPTTTEAQARPPAPLPPPARAPPCPPPTTNSDIRPPAPPRAAPPGHLRRGVLRVRVGERGQGGAGVHALRVADRLAPGGAVAAAALDAGPGVHGRRQVRRQRGGRAVHADDQGRQVRREARGDDGGDGAVRQRHPVRAGPEPDPRRAAAAVPELADPALAAGGGRVRARRAHDGDGGGVR